MKKERIETLVDSFTDSEGKVRYFVIAAISEVLPTTYDELYPEEMDENNPDTSEVNFYISIVDDYSDSAVDTVVKGVKLGFAICNPADSFNKELGETIAIGRAKKNSRYALYSTEPGYINSTLVQAFLKQEAEYFKKNPESRIKGYKRK